MSGREKFNETYDKVFDNKGCIKTCGREVCEALIILANEIEPEVKHGDLSSDFMNVESIKKLRLEIE